MIVSSPATVPATPSSCDSSIDRATTLAVPGGVLMTARNYTRVIESTRPLTTVSGAPTR